MAEVGDAPAGARWRDVPPVGVHVAAFISCFASLAFGIFGPQELFWAVRALQVVYAGWWLVAAVSAVLLRLPHKQPLYGLLLLPVLVTTRLLMFGVATAWQCGPSDRQFKASRTQLEALVASAPPPIGLEDDLPVEAPGRVGSISVQDAYRQGNAVIIHTGGCGLLDDSGLAHLPTGPFPELETGSFEVPEYDHITGPWYRWNASW
ncbi:MAG: hypothetical protein WKF86_06000 [Acidimicrobiales bacterium]